MPLTETVLLARHSPFNPIFITENREGLRTLRFSREGICQSIVKLDDPEFLALPYANVLPFCLGFGEKPQRILLVGLGGGTLLRFFHSILPETQLEVVEIDPDVVEVAKSHCGVEENDRIQIFIEDGRDFIESHEARYDLIILDSYGSESIPPHLLTAEFLHGVRAALTPRGIVAANVWGRSHNRFYEHMLLTYREVFEDVYVLDVPGPGTKIFVAQVRKEMVTREIIQQKTEWLPLKPGFRPQDLCYRNSDLERLRSGSVLRD
jgi:spermidine synthase